jgi:hypothetical protein
MAEKRTKENNREPGGLNADNPNTDRTPIQPRSETSTVGGTTQHNYTDEKEGNVPADTGKNHDQDNAGRS